MKYCVFYVKKLFFAALLGAAIISINAQEALVGAPQSQSKMHTCSVSKERGREAFVQKHKNKTQKTFVYRHRDKVVIAGLIAAISIVSGCSVAVAIAKRLCIVPKQKLAIAEPEDTECCICFESMVDDLEENPVVITRCKHTFHKSCLQQHFLTRMQSHQSNNCPLCRANDLVWPD